LLFYQAHVLYVFPILLSFSLSCLLRYSKQCKYKYHIMTYKTSIKEHIYVVAFFELFMCFDFRVPRTWVSTFFSLCTECGLLTLWCRMDVCCKLGRGFHLKYVRNDIVLSSYVFTLVFWYDQYIHIISVRCFNPDEVGLT